MYVYVLHLIYVCAYVYVHAYVTLDICMCMYVYVFFVICQVCTRVSGRTYYRMSSLTTECVLLL